MDKVKKERLLQEITFRTAKSSGPGGQSVNKLSTRVELLFSIHGSPVLTPREKSRIIRRLKNRINKEGVLIVAAEDTRSQLQNKMLATERFFQLLETALKEPKKRKKTKPTKSAVEKRLQEKKKLSEKKRFRRDLDL